MTGVQAAKWWQYTGRLPSLLLVQHVLLVLLAPGPAAGQCSGHGHVGGQFGLAPAGLDGRENGVCTCSSGRVGAIQFEAYESKACGGVGNGTPDMGEMSAGFLKLTPEERTRANCMLACADDAACHFATFKLDMQGGTRGRCHFCDGCATHDACKLYYPSVPGNPAYAAINFVTLQKQEGCAFTDGSTCSGHGQAQPDGSCVCDAGFTGTKFSSEYYGMPSVCAFSDTNRTPNETAEECKALCASSASCDYVALYGGVCFMYPGPCGEDTLSLTENDGKRTWRKEGQCHIDCTCGETTAPCLSAHCSGGGRCAATGGPGTSAGLDPQCTCRDGHTGALCEISDAGTCNGHGTAAADGTCVCQGAIGDFCEYSNAGMCHGNGVAVSPSTCSCTTAEDGADGRCSGPQTCAAECMATQRGNGRCDAQCDVEACGFDCNCETGIADCDTPCDCGSPIWITGTPAASILIYAYALVGLPWLAVLACMDRSWLDEFSETTAQENAVLVKPSGQRSRPVMQAEPTPSTCSMGRGLPTLGPRAAKIGHVLMYGCAVVGTLMLEWAASPTQTSSGLSGIAARGVERTNEATADANPQIVVVHALLGGLLLVAGGLYYLFQLFVFAWADPLKPAHPAAHYRALLANATSYPATIGMEIRLGRYKTDRTMQATSVDQSDEAPPGVLEEATAPLLRVEFEVMQSEDAAAAASFAEQRQAFQRENKNFKMMYREVCKVSDGPPQAWGSTNPGHSSKTSHAIEGGLVAEKPAPTLASSAAVRWISALAGLGWAHEAYIQRCTAHCTIRVRKRFFLPGAAPQPGPDGVDPRAANSRGPGVPQDPFAPRRGPLGPIPYRGIAIGNAHTLAPGPVAWL
jgi:hypothetical protein